MTMVLVTVGDVKGDVDCDVNIDDNFCPTLQTPYLNQSHLGRARISTVTSGQSPIQCLSCIINDDGSGDDR